MPIVVPRDALQPPKVKDDEGLLPIFQKNITGGMDSYFTIPMTPSPSSDAIGSGKNIYFDLERDECGQIDDVCIRLKVSCSNADVELVPPPFWFTSIKIESSKGSGDILKTIYPEEFFLWNQITQDEESRDRWSKLSNWSVNKLKEDGTSEKIWVSEKTKFKAGETDREIYLQIPALFFHLDAIDMKHIRSDLRIRFEMASDVVVSGDINNVSLTNVHLLVRSFNEESYDNARRQTRQVKNKHVYVYNDCERIQVSDKTYTAGQSVRIPMDQFVGKCGAIVCYLKPSTNPSASDKSLFNYQNLGTDATFDITNSAGQSLLGNGTAITAEQLNNVFCNHTSNPHLDGMYVIPFCEDLKKTMLGVPNGIFDFAGLHDYLEITFGSAPVQEVQEVSIGTTATSGTYRLAFENGVIDTGELDYNASTTDIQNALAAIPAVKDLNITCTVDNALDESTTQSFTFNANSGKVSEELGKLTYIGNGIPKVSSTTVSTYGNKGFTTGSDYELTILMYKFKKLIVDTKGNLTCKEL